MSTMPGYDPSLFTGRETSLLALQVALPSGQPVVMSGPRGVGTTTIASEYIQRFAQAYQDILWLNAATRETLLADGTDIIVRLKLANEQARERTHVLKTLHNWLISTDQPYLLVLDNVESIALVAPLLTPTSKGQILLITHGQEATQPSWRQLIIAPLEPKEAALLLRRRAELASPREQSPLGQTETILQTSQTLAQALGRLPLALTLAGAYSKETECSLEDYYRKLNANHPQNEAPLSIESVLRLTLPQLERQHPGAAELLKSCIFLAPQKIALALLARLNAEAQSETNQLEKQVRTLCAYGLTFYEEASSTLSISARTQSALHTLLSLEQQQTYGERVIRALFAQVQASAQASIPEILQLMAHIQRSTELSDLWTLSFPEAIGLFSWIGALLSQQEFYREAEDYYRKALAIAQRILSPNDLTISHLLHTIATLNEKQGNYVEAEVLLLQAIQLKIRTLGREHPDTLLAFNNLGSIYIEQRNRQKAEAVYQRALQRSETALGSEHPLTMTLRYNLGLLYAEWLNLAANVDEVEDERFAEAEVLLQQVHTYQKLVNGAEQIETIKTLHKLALIRLAQEKREQASAAYQEVLAAYTKLLGPTNPETLQCLEQMARLFSEQGKLAESETYLRQALKIREATVGTESADAATTLNSLAEVLIYQGKFEQAEPLIQQAITLGKQTLGPEHPVLAMRLGNLAAAYAGQQRYELGLTTFQEMIAIWAKTLGPEHFEVQKARAQYRMMVSLLEQQKSPSS